MYSRIFVSFFFLQAEDGIRVGHVTGVQTCALPISAAGRWRATLRPGLLPARRRLSTFLAARRELETGTLRGESPERCRAALRRAAAARLVAGRAGAAAGTSWRSRRGGAWAARRR